MCLNCGYTYASENGFCSELCQREFTEEAEQAESESEEESAA